VDRCAGANRWRKSLVQVAAKVAGKVAGKAAAAHPTATHLGFSARLAARDTLRKTGGLERVSHLRCSGHQTLIRKVIHSVERKSYS
jgi:hypothetical protein